MSQVNDDALEQDGFCLIPAALSSASVASLATDCCGAFESDLDTVRARSSRGHVYAARNLIGSIDSVTTVWQTKSLLDFLYRNLGNEFGLVRALFFDKPPDRTWNLPWHKDTAIAVRENSVHSPWFSRPTLKSGVPHYVADDEILKRMLTLRIHLDDVTEENGPLKVIPQSHRSSDSAGIGVEKSVTVFANAGDVLAMRPLISHSSSASKADTKRHRRILHLEFAADRQLPDGVQWHDYVRPMSDE